MIVALQEWQTATPRDTPELRLPPLGAQGRARLDEINARGEVEILEVREGLRVQTKRFVGTLQLEELTLVIQPRLSPQATSTLLRYAYDLPQTIATEARHVHCRGRASRTCWGNCCWPRWTG